MTKPFPMIALENIKPGGEDRNPGIQLFGRRFYGDQTSLELLIEFLLVASSSKRVGDAKAANDKYFPSVELLRNWPSEKYLEYAPKPRMNLKLFTFLGASKLDTRHESHREHYKYLIDKMLTEEKLVTRGSIEKSEALSTLENLFLGFQGIGGDRTWCAQAFLPISINTLCAETIWNETTARRDSVGSWSEVVDRFLHYFSLNRHRFLSRGGEVLYLQVCNALRQQPSDIVNWFRGAGFSFDTNESDPELLYTTLEECLSLLMNACPEMVDKLASFIDTGVESETANHTEKDGSDIERFTKCGWCPEESWPEGYLFAVEFTRICRSVIDPIERIEMLETACAMQLLRSLCAQSSRYAPLPLECRESAAPLGYVWIFSDPEGENNIAKQLSRRCLKTVQLMIHDAIRREDIRANVEQQKDIDIKGGKVPKDPYKEADTAYGHKLFLTVAKRMGMVVPKQGQGARFVMNDRMLRYFVVSMLRPGDRVTYETFKQLLFAHYGVALDDSTISRVSSWSGTSHLCSLNGKTDDWFEEMLAASGVLIRLSDACSMVINPFDGRGA